MVVCIPSAAKAEISFQAFYGTAKSRALSKHRLIQRFPNAAQLKGCPFKTAS
jgi:hypothetical protein